MTRTSRFLPFIAGLLALVAIPGPAEAQDAAGKSEPDQAEQATQL